MEWTRSSAVRLYQARPEIVKMGGWELPCSAFAGRIDQTRKHDAVFNLASGTAILSLHSRRLGAFLGDAGLGYYGDGVCVGETLGHKSLHPLANRVLVPDVRAC